VRGERFLRLLEECKYRQRKERTVSWMPSEKESQKEKFAGIFIKKTTKVKFNVEFLSTGTVSTQELIDEGGRTAPLT